MTSRYLRLDGFWAIILIFVLPDTFSFWFKPRFYLDHSKIFSRKQIAAENNTLTPNLPLVQIIVGS